MRVQPDPKHYRQKGEGTVNEIDKKRAKETIPTGAKRRREDREEKTENRDKKEKEPDIRQKEMNIVVKQSRKGEIIEKITKFKTDK